MSLVQSPHTRTQRLVAYALIAAGLIGRWPVLYTGFTVDDYAHLAMMDGTYPVPREPLSLFTFSDGSLAENARLRETGFFPWWSDPQLRVSLLRPLSSALMWFDAAVFRSEPFACHLHSAVWWTAMVWVLWQFLRCVTTGWATVAALAVVIAHPLHTVMLGWVANRNALVATTFAVLGLIAQLYAQQTKVRVAYLLAAASYACSLLASEYAVPTLAYGFLLSLLGPAPPSNVGRTIAIWCTSGAAYLVLRASLDFGTRGSGMYIDPVREPLAFLAAAATRIPVLMGDVLLAIRSTWWSAGFPWTRELVEHGIVSPGWAEDLRSVRRVLVLTGAFACVLFLVVTWRWTGRAPSAPRHDQRFLALGMPLTLVPCAASLPESRLMLPALIGWAAVLAQAFFGQVETWRGTRRWRAAANGSALGGLLTLAIVLPIASGAGEITGFPALAQAVRESILAPALDSVFRDRRQVLLVSAIDPTTTIYLPMIRRRYGRPAPESCQLLVGGWGPVRVTRVSLTALEIERLNRNLTGPDVYASAFNRAPLSRGQRFRSGGMEAVVLSVHEGRPIRVRFELHRPLESSLTMLVQSERGLRPVEFPLWGRSFVLKAASLPLGGTSSGS